MCYITYWYCNLKSEAGALMLTILKNSDEIWRGGYSFVLLAVATVALWIENQIGSHMDKGPFGRLFLAFFLDDRFIIKMRFNID